MRAVLGFAATKTYPLSSPCSGVRCNPGFIPTANGCVCDAIQCPNATKGVATCTVPGSCAINCNDGFTTVGNTCVCDADECPHITNGVATCTVPGVPSSCNFTCNAGFNKQSGACVAAGPACVASAYSKLANSVSICTSSCGACDFTCNTDFNKQGGACIAIPSACTKKSVALFQNFQTTKNDERAVTVASL